MTTIAYRDGILAADTGITSGNIIAPGSVVKIVVMPDGRLAGASGDASFVSMWLRWAASGAPEPSPEIKERDGNTIGWGLIVERDGSVTEYDSAGSFNMVAPYYALGSGEQIALGAMWAGASAEDAVRAAIAIDKGTSGDVVVLNLGDVVLRQVA